MVVCMISRPLPKEDWKSHFRCYRLERRHVRPGKSYTTPQKHRTGGGGHITYTYNPPSRTDIKFVLER